MLQNSALSISLYTKLEIICVKSEYQVLDTATASLGSQSEHPSMFTSYTYNELIMFVLVEN